MLNYQNKNLQLMVTLSFVTILAQACQRGSTREQAQSFERLGGDGTVYDTSANAFSFVVPNLNSDESRSFFKGRALFRDPWVIAPSSTKSRDGLGPLFNARSCEACHLNDGRGQPPESPSDPFTTMLVRISISGEDPHGGPSPVPEYGGQLQNFSIPGVEADGQPRVAYEEVQGTYVDGDSYVLLRPTYTFEALSFGPMPDDVMYSPRVAPSMIGLGLLEAIPESSLLNKADPDDWDQDGVSGRVNMVWDAATSEHRIGRFGWKANQPNLRQQTAGAFLGDIGITSSLFTENECPESSEACAAAVNGGEPELLDVILDNVSIYSATLAVPAGRGRGDPDVQTGYERFLEAGCDSCHTPTWITGESAFSDALSGQEIHPFTDLLLHDMGEELSDGRPDFLATGSEWRTPPLWGLGLQQTVNGHLRLLHDGRARGFAEAILWHGGEGELAKQAFLAMGRQDREALIQFLESL